MLSVNGLGWKSNRGPHSAGTSWQHFSGNVTLPKGPASEFVCSPSWSTCSIPFAVFIYCPSSHLLDWRSKQKLLFSASWRRLQGERRRRGVLGLTGELLPLMTRHTATCALLSRSLSLPLHTHTKSFLCLLQVISFWPKSQEAKLHHEDQIKLSTDTVQTSKKHQPSQTKTSHIITTFHKTTLTPLPSKSSLSEQHALSAHSLKGSWGSEFVLERWEAIDFCFCVLSCSYESTASDSRKQKWSQQATSSNTSISDVQSAKKNRVQQVP